MRKLLLRTTPWITFLCFIISQALPFSASFANSPAHYFQQELSLKAVLEQVGSHYKVAILFEERIVAGKKTKYRFDPAGNTIEKVLNELLPAAGLKAVKIDNRHFAVLSRVTPSKTEDPKQQETDTNNPEPQPLQPEEQVSETVAVTGAEKQAERTITGRVLNSANNEPLPGASVLVRNTKQGIATNRNGEFSITIPASATGLVVQYVGYIYQEIPLTSKSNYVIKLESTRSSMEDVIVTGIVTRKKGSFTGATAAFNGEQLKAVGNTNIIQSLKTLDPSFVLLENNNLGSNPNALPEIEIRGKTSVPQSSLRDQFGADPNQPLFILDGFDVSLRTILDLDMNRVASVTILKDAASTAMYGAKAANGVVVIETRAPKPGSMQLSYTGDFRSEIPDLSGYNLMNSTEKLEFERLAGMYSHRYPQSYPEQQYRLDSTYNNRLAEVQRGVNTYWLNEPVQVGFTNGHTVRAEGGDGQMRYAIGLNYKDTKGAMKGSGRKTWGGNVDLVYRRSRLNIANKLFVNGYNATESPYGSFSIYARTNPYYRKYNENGGFNKYLEIGRDRNFEEYRLVNPIYNSMLNSRDITKSNSVQNNLQMIYTILNGLELQGGLQVRKETTTQIQFTSPEDSQFDNVSIFERGRYRDRRLEEMSYQGNLMLTYSRVIEKLHSIMANARAELQENNFRSITNTATGFPVGSNGNPAFSFGYDPEGKPDAQEKVFRRNNALLSVNYAFDQRFLFDASYRMDGSTAFGSNKRYSPFWTIGAGWNLHNEGTFSKVKWINTFRLRANMGYTGNQNFGNISSISTYRFDPYINYFGQGVTLQTLGNPDLQWQRTFNTNIGTDLTLFGNKLSATFNVFEKKTDPLVVVVDLPSSIGIYGYPLNAGKMITRGAEAIIRFSPVYKPEKSTVWTIGFNGTVINSKYAGFRSKLEGLNKQQLESKSLLRYNDGYSPDDIWAVYSLGIDPATGREVFLKKNGEYTFEYDPMDIRVVGNSRPTMEGVISSTLMLKGFTFGLNLRYQYGGDVFNYALFNKVENISLAELPYNHDKRALYDRWKQVGDVTTFKGISIASSTPISSRFVQEDNTLIGESVNLGYMFQGKNWMKAIHLNTLRINAYMNDIFRISTVRRERGIDYPFAKTIALSINASF